MNTTVAGPVLLVAAADLASEVLDILGNFGVVFIDGQPTENDIVALYTRHRPVAITVCYDKINIRIMDAVADNLRMISKHGSGIDVIDQDTAAARGTAVYAIVGANAAIMAEHAWALILAYAKPVPQLDAHMHAGHWDKATHKSIELDGRTLGLVGLGAVRRRTATIGLVSGMKVLVFDLYTRKAPVGVQLVVLGELYTRSDIVSLHCPLIVENRKMLNRSAFSCFKPGAILVNTTRGDPIDEAALVEALANDRPRVVRLDSFDVEPMVVPHPSQDVANIILSPYTGGVSDAAYLNMGKGAVTNVPTVIEERARTAA